MSYTYSYFGSPTYSTSFDNLDDMMNSVLDNTQNLIDPKDIRDSLLTLWYQNSQFSLDYIRSLPTPITVGGATIGSTFSGTVQDALDKILYPYIAPSDALSASISQKEFGSPTAVTLNWSVTKHSNPITSIVVAGTTIVPSGNSEGGTQAVSATQNVNTTFTMTVSDGVATTTATTTVSWLNKRYWGKFPTFGALTSANISGLSGAGVGTGSELSSTHIQTRNNMDGGGQYLVFAFPSSFTSNAQFTVNGLPNTAWTKVNSNFAFINTFGYTTNYDVYMSNTAQNSPVAEIKIT